MLIGFEGEDEGAGAAEGAADDEESSRIFEVLTAEAAPTPRAAPRVNVKELALPRQQSAKYRSIHQWRGGE